MKMEKIRDDIEVPIIDLSNRSEASKQIIKACEELGFFKVINHGVPQEIISQIEEEARAFFSKPGSEKMRAGPPNPYGYGCKNIGLKGDVGEVEYLLLHPNSPFLSTHSDHFRCAAMGYVEAVKKLACEILDVMVEGLVGPDPNPKRSSVLSRLIRDSESDSILRFNHYPPSDGRIGFGEHTDPQILTLLRSNGAQGLQISVEDGVWVPVSPHPHSAFCVNVGDVLQVMTNGRFMSVRHRVAVQSYKSRMSMAYFAAPPLHATIGCLPGLATAEKPALFRSFSWGEYKEAAFTRRLGDSRLNLFTLLSQDN
uniref:Gibberellin 2beta-dioxygenase n=1 Tax=Isodon rubescens TaxID=587669 RepID=A0A8T9JC70_ISORU|nr:gibberellin 2beta-dioxygenase [Isodon rubescens]